MRRGAFDTALQDVQRARQRYAPKSVEWAWRFRVLQAQILVSRAEYKAALALLSEQLPAQLRSSDIEARKEMVEGIAYRYAQQFENSREHLALAERLAAAIPELLCQVLNAQGALAVDENRYASAEALFHRALVLARVKNLTWSEVTTLGNLGRVATSQEHFDEGLDWDRSALRLAQSLGTQAAASAILGNMAWNYRTLGDFDNALSYYKQAEDASARSGSIGNQIYWLTGMSNVYYEEREYGLAEAVLAQALDLARRHDDKRTLVEFLNDLAEIALETGHTERTEKYYAEVAQIEQAGLDQSGVLESLLIKGRLDEAHGAFAEAAKSFQRVINDPKTESAQKWEAEARLAHVYADEGRYERAENKFRDSLATIESLRSSVQGEDLRLSFLSTAISFYDDYIEFLISRHRPEDALQVAELSRARTLAEGLGTAPKTLSFPLRNFQPPQIAQRTKSILLFYWLGQKESYVWAITPTKVNCATLPGATEIDPLVKSYREAVLSGRDVLEGGNSDGEKLYTLLIEPAKKLIPPGSRVILLPDGSLYGLNFETLLVPGPKPHFWIDDVTLTSASSLTLLSAARNSSAGINSIGRSAGARQARGIHQRYVDAAFDTEHRDPANAFRDGNLLLVGDATQAAAEFPALRQARAEMAQVGRYFPESRRAVLAGPQATPSKFLASGPERFAYLHFVTHGSASRAHPLDSAVILSPDGDSFKLYARDIVKHPLSAYLVTISACSGSGTRAYSGEGLVGLSWAFLRAGAHNVIAALWEVSDTSTPQLMDRLYGELSQGQDPASALRTAKLSLLKSDSVFKKPFYWAPFQLYAGS
jgi:CHAT domain-containing protein